MIQVDGLFIDERVTLRPCLLQLVLQFELDENTVEDLRLEKQIRSGERCIMPCYNHLHDLSSRESLSFPADTLDNFVVDILHADQFSSSDERARISPPELQLLLHSLGWLAILDEVMVEHGPALRLTWPVEADDLVDTIMHSTIKLIWSVRRHDDNDLVRRGTSAIQERVNRVSHILGHILLERAISKESICLIDEENHAIGLVFCPVKDSV